MSDQKPSLVILTNLYPLPWEPNRATFNRQQFALLEEEYQLSILIPIAFGEWIKRRKQITQSSDRRYVPYFYTPKFGRRFYSWFMLFSILLHSGRWLKSLKPDLLLASWAYPEGVAGSWLGRLLGCRFYLKVHGSDINLHGRIPSRAKQITAAADRASGILSVSKALRDEMARIGIDPDKVHVIYNGVDHDKFGKSDPGEAAAAPYILYVGNLKKDKGVIELMEGFASVSEEFPTLELKYAGNGLMKSEIQQLAARYGLSERVKLLGSVDHDQLPPIIQNAQALALPSYNEGVPNVVLEAMASGTPVLATDVGGIPEVMVEDVTGLLITPREHQEVAAGLRGLLEREWDAEKILQHSLSFSWQKNKQQLLRMLGS